MKFIETNDVMTEIIKKEEDKFTIFKKQGASNAFNCGISSNVIKTEKCFEMKIKILDSLFTQTMFGIMPKEKFNKDGKLSSYYFYNKTSLPYQKGGIFYCAYDDKFYLNETQKTFSGTWGRWIKTDLKGLIF
jgi:hypothetical protein